MGSAIRFSSFRFIIRCVCLGMLLPALSVSSAYAASPEEASLDTTTLLSLEQRAAAAEPRDRCYLYTELLHGWTELASKAMSDGRDTEAVSAMQRADDDAAKLKEAIGRDSKRLKNAELLLEHTAHRLSDMVRVASMEQHDAMQGVLRHLNSVHDDLLAQIFAH